MAKIKRKIIKIDEDKCNGCGVCIPSCPEGALAVVDTPKGKKVRLMKENFCDGLGACLKGCPRGAMCVVEDVAESYDEEGVIAHIRENAPEKLEQHMKHLREHADELPAHHAHAVGGGCPGSLARQWGAKEEREPAGEERQGEKTASELRQWPVQIMLVNPQASYFQDADLLVAADCVPFAYPDFHREFLKGKTVVVGCPKLDDVEYYREKFADLFKSARIRSVTVLMMEVPCCSGLSRIVQEAIKASGKKIPYCDVVISIKGEVLS